MTRSRRIGVLGGTFDPVHLGHLVVASEIHHVLGLDEILLVPTGRPWQKADRAVSSAEHRVRMTELAVDGDARMRVSTVDVDRPGATYSADTLSDLRTEYGDDADFYFVTGMDALAGLPTWHEVDRVLEQAVVVGCARRGHADVLPEGVDPARVRLVATTVIDVSSTQIRGRVAAGEPVRYLVPDAVERYISDHGLYRDAA